MSIAAAALAISLAAPAHGHAFVVGSSLKQAVLVSTTAAIGCNPQATRCPTTVGVTFGDRPGLVYPARVLRVSRDGEEGTIAQLRVERSLPAFPLATAASLGDEVALPAWCGGAATYVASVGQSGSHVRIGIATAPDQAGCPVLDASLQAVAVVRGTRDPLAQEPGFETLQAVVLAAGQEYFDPGWQFASRDAALARARSISAADPRFPDSLGGEYELLQERAMPWWCRAADLGDAEASAMCARALGYAKGALRDGARALALAKIAADAGAKGARELLDDLDQQYGRTLATIPDVTARAKAGDAHAMETLGGRYRGGYVGPEDRTASLGWYERCAETVPACADQLGTGLINGWGAVPDVPRGVRFLEAAAQSGLPEANYHLGMHYTYTYVPGWYDPVKARHYLEIVAASTSTYAAFARDELAKLPKANLAALASQPTLSLEERINAAKAVAEGQQYAAAPLFEELAKTGDPRALMAAGFFYRTASALKWGRSNDDETSLQYFKRASAAGSYRGTYEATNTGNLISLAERNALLKLSVQQAKTAAQAGDAAAYVYVGTGIAYGYDGAPDCREAIRWLELAAAKHATDAEYELGMRYTLDPKYTEPINENPCIDMRLGEQWLRRGVEHGQPRAAFRLAELFESGRVGRRDLAEAKRLYGIAAAAGDVLARLRLDALNR